MKDIAVEVAVLVPVDASYHYLAPAGTTVGARVWVPFGGRRVEGVVLGPAEAPVAGLKPIVGRVTATGLDPTLVTLARWVASYYAAPIGEALRLCLPPGGKASEAERVALTVEGAQLASQIGAALEPADLAALDGDERALLAALALPKRSRARPSPLVMARLIARGLVTRERTVSARRERTETLIAIARTPIDRDAEPALARAPRRRALYDLLCNAANETPLSSLRALDARAAEHVKALVIAGLVTTREVPADSDFSTTRDAAPLLNADQLRVLGALRPALALGAYAPFLLHGVTGSGKTEVYLHLIADALAKGLGALVIVPEIALTPQLAARFRARFGDEVAVLHSGLSNPDRFAAWSRLADGRVRIALGARSAVFAPVPRLGVVVVDEEHDGSFKQEEGVRYHGRDVALRRARAAGAVAVLGSATPSLEIYAAARESRLTLLELPSRATPRPLPTVEVIDLRQHVSKDGDLLSAPLVRALEQTLTLGEQSILFLNRRGFSTVVLCRACGHRFGCKHCAVTLTWHRSDDRLVCHYCGYRETPPARCPHCASASVEKFGLGTERVAAIVSEKFPSARVARLDRDTSRGDNLVKVLDAVRAREIDVLVGTQLIAKGHDFPGVTLVGVVLADAGMSLPDFRAVERTYQLLEQVSGRAGRGERAGRVLIQTFVPGNAAVRHARNHDYASFFVEEMESRKEWKWPPHSRVALLRFDGADAREVIRTANEVARVAALAAVGVADLLGPAEAPLSRLKGLTRWHLLIKGPTLSTVRAVVAAALAHPVSRGVRVTVDVDPVSML